MDSHARAKFLKEAESFIEKMEDFWSRQVKKTEQENTQSHWSPENGYHYSQTVLKKLKLTTLDELIHNQQAKGFYVTLKSLMIPVYVKSTHMLKGIVQDTDGNIVVLNILSFEDKDVFSPGTVFNLKEPYLAADDEMNAYSVYCTSPTDLMPIERSAKEISDSNLDKVIPPPDTSNCWMEQGDEFFRNKEYSKALEYYFVSLKMAIKRKEGFKVIRALNLKISDIYFELKCFENALTYAQKVSNNHTALYIAGRSYYALRQFEKSADQFKQLLLLKPADELGCEGSKKCKARLGEQMLVTTERIEEIRLFTESESHPKTSIECADYTGPVKLYSTKSGVKVVATRDILPGTLLMVTKSVAQFYSTPFDRKDNSAIEMVTQLAKMMKRNPTILGNQVYEWMKNCFGRDSVNQYCDGSDTELSIDIGSLLNLEKKCFTKLVWYRFEAELGLYILPTYCKESCVPNAQWQTYNNIMVVHSIACIKKGKEVKLKKRESKLSLQTTSNKELCACVLCTLDKKESTAVLKEHLLQNKTFEGMMKRNDFTGLEGLIERIEKTYNMSGRKQFQVDLFLPYLTLSSIYIREKGFGDALRVADQALAVLGLDRYTLQKCTEENPDSPVFPDNVLVTNWILRIVFLYKTFYLTSNQLKVSTWENISSCLIKLFYGDVSALYFDEYYFGHLPEPEPQSYCTRPDN